MPLPPDAHPAAGLRIAFYSHDTVGLGHVRRNIALAAALVEHRGDVDVLLITGNPEAASLPLPERTDVVTLPTLAKAPDGRYRSRTLSAPLDAVLSVRSALIEAVVTAFRPDVWIADKVPLGVAGELRPALEHMRETRTRTVLGLREVLDDPVSAVRDWESADTTAAIERYYDAVWVYGDPDVYDPVVEYGLPASVAAKVSYTGYLGRNRYRSPEPASEDLDSGDLDSDAPVPGAVATRPYVLCTVGGGQDGAALARTFAGCPLPLDHDGVVVCGPFMAAADRAEVHRAAETVPGMRVYDFVPGVDRLLAGASAVVSMAGYNSVCEVLAGSAPALLVPRSRPRAEQLVRAERLSELGLADVLPAERLDARVLRRWIGDAVRASAQPAARADGRVDLDGLARVPGLVSELIAHRTRSDRHAA